MTTRQKSRASCPLPQQLPPILGVLSLVLLVSCGDSAPTSGPAERTVSRGELIDDFNNPAGRDMIFLAQVAYDKDVLGQQGDQAAGSEALARWQELMVGRATAYLSLRAEFEAEGWDPSKGAVTISASGKMVSGSNIITADHFTVINQYVNQTNTNPERRFDFDHDCGGPA